MTAPLAPERDPDVDLAIDRTTDRQGRGRGWVLLSALLLVGALLGGLVPSSAIDWQPSRAASEPWRWWTAAFVHLSPLHLGANALGAVVVAWLGWSARLPVRVAVAWALAWPLTHLGLGLLAPTLAHYGGLSGVLHAGVAAAAVHLVVAPGSDGADAQEARRRRTIGLGIGLVLLAKLLLEAPWGPPARAVDGWDIPVAPIAHSTGALAAALVACVLEGAAWRRMRAAPAADDPSPPRPTPGALGRVPEGPPRGRR